MSTQSKAVSGEPEGDASPQTARLHKQQVSDDRLQDLIAALGDSNHPQHSAAIGELIEIGPDAVPALSAALSPNYPWLTSYRAAEALAQIGDGRASGALIGALHHPNSNVRWSVVRALAEIGDTRTLWALRRVAHEDRGKTSWGESVADTAQLALDRLQSRSVLLRFSEPIKTALMLVAVLAVLVFASTRVQALRNELRPEASATEVVAAPAEAETTTAEPEAAPAATAEASTPEPSASPSPEPQPIVGKVVQGGNVRAEPSVNSRRIGSVQAGDEVVFLAQSGDWYRIRLGEKHRSGSTIQGDEGWVNQVLVGEPNVQVPTAPAP